MEENKNMPQLRFQEFNNNWEKSSLGSIAHFSKGKNISKQDISDDGEFECIRYGELYTTYGELINNIVSRTNLQKKYLVLSKINDVIIPASGETQEDIAKASCVTKADVALGGDLNIIRSPLNGVFLSYYLNNKRKYDIARVAQGISVVHLYSSQLKTIKLNLPSLLEQQKIASFLSAVDDKIRQLTRKKELLEKYKKGVMQKIFKQEIRFKREDGSDYPDWEIKRAKEVFRNHSNKNHNGDLPILAASQERGMVFRSSIDIQITSSEASVKSYKVVEKGDFVISLRSFQGGIEYSYLHGICSPAYTILKPRIKIVDEFFRYYFKKDDFIERLSKTIIGIRDGKQITYENFGWLKLYIPSIDEQHKISDFLNSLDKKIEQITLQLEKTREFKKGLLQQMFV